MGITGLLPLLKQIQEPTTLVRYSGKTLAIDTYAWLHRSILSCPMELAQEKPTVKYINYVLRRIEMLHHFGITPFLVFDGDYLPCKNNTEIDRESRRNEYKKQGLLALQKGDSRLAFSCFQKSCDITPAMAKLLIDVLKERNIKYVVAPYEADSQMVYLEKMGIVDGIISEDSDLLVFGCHRLITKLNDRGECVEINRDNFKKCKQVPVQYLSQEQLRMVAALSGCDYTKGIPGIGIIKAFALIKKHGNIEKLVMAMKLEGKFKIPENFLEEFERANFAFQYQLVFDPISNSPAHMSEIPADASPALRIFSGERLDDDIHRKIAAGDLHPIEKTVLISREKSLLLKTGASTAIRTASLYQGNIVNSSGYTPVKMASRAYSTPIPVKSGPIDGFFSLKKKSSDSYITPVSVKRPKEISPKKEFKDTTKVSPIAKRKRILHGDTATTTNSLHVSKFFTAKISYDAGPSITTASSETQELPDIDLDSQPLSLVDVNEGEKQTNVCKNSQLHGLNSSDFEIDELSENEEGEEQILLTQTQTPSSVENLSTDNLLKSLTGKISRPNSAVDDEKLTKHIIPSSDNDDLSEVESPIYKKKENRIDEVRIGLRNKFGFGEMDTDKSPLKATVPAALNRQQPSMEKEKYQYKSRKLEKNSIRNSENKGITSSFVDKTKKLNLDSYIFRG